MRIPGLWRLNRYFENIRYSAVAGSMDKNPSEAIQIFGDPRSGTTWLAETIQSVTNRAIIWEPLSIGNVPEFRKLNFGWRQFIPENEIWPEAKDTFQKLYRGKILNYWLCQKTGPEQLKNRQLIFKFCRANQLLPWLTKNFVFSSRPIYLIRHPFAVVASQLKQGGWNYDFKGFEIPDIRFNDVYKKHEHYLKQLKSQEEYMVAVWCMSNKYSLNHQKNNIDWLTISYEDLLLKPEQSWERIFNALGIEVDLNQLETNKKSSTAIEGRPMKGKAQIEQWKNYFSDAEIENLITVLEYFDIKVYSDSAIPQIHFN